jgi:hypothetical protein
MENRQIRDPRQRAMESRSICPFQPSTRNAIITIILAYRCEQRQDKVIKEIVNRAA